MKNLSVCGIDCSIACVECNSSHEELQKNPCKGCNAEKGQIFWTKFMGLDTCPIYSCATEKQLTHCGKCTELPCNIYFEMKDPSISDERHQQGIMDRVEVLKNL
ncbi:MAG: DUF3795 domain-containing protein [Bacteroidales bacterium]|jgi:hypothetical protein|nr:DUF3795 domain-containing protein [Bacteroidales bacterium]